MQKYINKQLITQNWKYINNPTVCVCVLITIYIGDYISNIYSPNKTHISQTKKRKQKRKKEKMKNEKLVT